MDMSSLTRAHDHARAAAVATRSNSADTTVAINEHTQAAGEFATTATSTSSVEALRMLKLLEDHHRKLATLLDLPAQQPAQPAHDADDICEKGHDRRAKSNSGTVTVTEARTVTSTQKPSAPQDRKKPPREMSSSIASNLASARGIRSKHQGQPLSPSISKDQAPGNVDAHPRRDGSQTKMQNIIESKPGKPTWVPPHPSTDSMAKQKMHATPPSPSDNMDDGGYGRFYNAFGGLLSRISAPLAFAGLPLVQEEPDEPESAAPEVTVNKRRTVKSARANEDPDLSKIYSQATMHTIKNAGHGPTESFYVVPMSGGTMSYANIVRHEQREKRRNDASQHSFSREDEDDDFVDASETPVPRSPDAQRNISRNQADKQYLNTIEELSTQNKSLKDMLDKLTKRLHAFEASAQNMAMSYRPMRPGSPLSTTSKAPVEAIGKKQVELEQEMHAMRQHAEKLEKDNIKMQKTLEKYRQKWETLKAGAKARREAQSGGDSIEDARNI
ncbi:uncharacterized protein J7T54_002344 [Emericellopsis cladophorae]|uniref:Uncharacterized protein n=1 Tax=Emericellopsis cladophorae TaxID=2686198 RepID=A0A9Q0BE62_9HYPO|nr:uncharacterized protein J7T54_002344 [Emericellopsis cladophorae]KAI6782107.1 hypothetical protein J7T54_002344 [Emericellopsis cladophorae]